MTFKKVTEQTQFYFLIHIIFSTQANTLQICFLLLDIALASQDALRAAVSERFKTATFFF